MTIFFTTMDVFEPISIKLIWLISGPIGFVFYYNNTSWVKSFEHNVNSSNFCCRYLFVTLLDVNACALQKKCQKQIPLSVHRV